MIALKCDLVLIIFQLMIDIITNILGLGKIFNTEHHIIAHIMFEGGNIDPIISSWQEPCLRSSKTYNG